MSTCIPEPAGRRNIVPVVVRSLALALLCFIAALSTGAEPPQEVFIANFPDQQEVRGTVSVDGVIPHSRMVRFEDNVVTPVSRSEYTNLREIGELDAAGFSDAVLSLVGEVKGSGAAGGKIGLVLLPDEEPIFRAFRDQGQMLLPLELDAEFEPGSSGVFADTKTLEVRFPRYRLFLYNESSSSVTANAYVYLRH